MADISPEMDDLGGSNLATECRRTAPSCVIVGAAGFLGRYLVRSFADAGYVVRGLGHGPPPDPSWGIADFRRLHVPDGHVIELLARWKPRLCIYAAGPGEAAPRSESARESLAEATTAWTSLLEAVRLSAPGCQVVFLSSAAVYGRTANGSVKEVEPCLPLSPYGLQKAECEVLAEQYRLQHGLRISVGRVFNVYGPEQRRQLLWDLCRRAIEARDGRVELFGDGAERRDFIHVQDVCAAIRLIAEASSDKPWQWNVGTGVSTTVRQVAEGIAARWPHQLSLSFNGQARPAQTYCACADISRLRGLGFVPRWKITAGLDQYAEWFLSRQMEQVNR